MHRLMAVIWFLAFAVLGASPLAGWAQAGDWPSVVAAARKEGRVQQRGRAGTEASGGTFILFLGSMRLNMGAFLSMSGTMTKRTRLPRMKMCST